MVKLAENMETTVKIKAEVIPFSSIVGGGVMLLDETGRCIGQLMLMNVRVPGQQQVQDEVTVEAGAFRKTYTELAEHVRAALNAYQVERQVTHTKRGTTYDVVAERALFQVSAPPGLDGPARMIHDGDPVIIYRNPEGMHFVRFPDEMVSPRFEKV